MNRNNLGQFVNGNKFNIKPPIIKVCPNCSVSFEVCKQNPLTKYCCHQCFVDHVLKGKPKSDEHKRKIKENHAKYWLGKHNPLSSGLARKYLTPFNKGENHPNWKGGITPLLQRLRFTKEYKEWRSAVFERDNYTCLECGNKGGILNADHIETFAKLVYENDLERLKDINNGRTLCVDCHRKVDTYARRFQPVSQQTI